MYLFIYIIKQSAIVGRTYILPLNFVASRAALISQTPIIVSSKVYQWFDATRGTKKRLGHFAHPPLIFIGAKKCKI